MRRTMTAIAIAAVTLVPGSSAAQAGRPRLHVDTRWKQCSFQLDPVLTQSAWRQFTEEAGLRASGLDTLAVRG